MNIYVYEAKNNEMYTLHYFSFANLMLTKFSCNLQGSTATLAGRANM